MDCFGKKIVSNLCAATILLWFPQVSAAEIAARLLRIVDGDTLIVRTQSGRKSFDLAGIETPERGQPYASDAMQAIVRMTRSKILLLRPVPGEDSGNQGKIDVEVILSDSRSLNRELVAAGLATARPDSALGESLLPVEHYARFQKKGRWAEKNKKSPSTSLPSSPTVSKPVATSPISSNTSPMAVFVEPRSAIYHMRGCELLKAESAALPLRMARDHGMSPCNICRPPF